MTESRPQFAIFEVAGVGGFFIAALCNPSDSVQLDARTIIRATIENKRPSTVHLRQMIPLSGAWAAFLVSLRCLCAF